MRRAIVVATLLILVLSGCVPGTFHPNKPPKPSAVGAIVGDPITATIGSGGGSVASADKRITVTIPAGALTADTEIGVQPIENTDAAGFGMAYRLTPDGQKFAKPVTVAFTYAKDDLDSTYAGSMRIAFQDKAGLWEVQKTKVDEAAKTLLTTSTHFTDFSALGGIQLSPASKRLKLGRSLELKLVDCTLGFGQKVYVLYACDDAYEGGGVSGFALDSWAVNGAPGGTNGIGLVAGGAFGATYKAPKTKPSTGSHVAVSVKVKPDTGKNFLISSDITLLSGYYLDGHYSETHSGLVCAGGYSNKVSDSFTADIVADASDDGFAVTDMADAKTAYAPVVVEFVGVGTVTTPPEMFDSLSGVVQTKKDSDTLKVILTGSTTLGVCAYGGQIISEGATRTLKIHISFDITKIPPGGSIKVHSTDTDQVAKTWEWTISEK
ncbi:MAG TPA: hypothetical protein VGM38_05810 [Pseudolysinimonas sp.]